MWYTHTHTHTHTHTQWNITQPLKKSEIMPFAATWLHLDIIIRSTSDREWQIPYDITYISSPQPFWHQGPVLWQTVFPQPGGGGVGEGSGGNASDGEWWGVTGEASLTRLPLTSFCAAWFLTGWGLGTPDLYAKSKKKMIQMNLFTKQKQTHRHRK